MALPSLPYGFSSVISYLNKSASSKDLLNAVQPYVDYETKLRQIFAQEPQHAAIALNHLVPVFSSEQLLTKARDIESETCSEKEKYLLTLPDSLRRRHGSPATVTSIKEFKTNFSIFSEQALADLDWSNVVAAGSSVVTSLLPVDPKNSESKRALRAYYHEKIAPASDVDLFIYGLDEEHAIAKIKQIETCIRDSVLAETTTIRTKNTITIVSEHPIRHVQIVLRLYNSITEILTGFDVDCSCVAFDGKQVWASPRALAAYATQQNNIDFTRRSPSYENRLSKYSRRGFEVYWPSLDRTRIDPTIYERSFNRVVGLARLLVLEKLPHPVDRDAFAAKRRQERNRPELPWNARYRHALPGNVKDAQPDDIPEWFDGENHSDYHTFIIPYGPKYNAKKIEKLLFKQDLLLNAEWNKPKDRETKLHRHPAFFGSVEDVIEDCCGFCSDPETDRDLEYQEEESKLYISGKLTFVKDNPGRQAIGSFNPLTTDDWTDMAYIGLSSRLCQAIVAHDIQAVKDWFHEEGADVNRRDHTGRTPLHLACMCSTPEIVQVLLDHGARTVSRIYSGMTALHMAASRGSAQIVGLLLDKSEANGKEEDRKEEVRKQARRAAAKPRADTKQDDEDIEMIDTHDEDSDSDGAVTEGSFVNVKDQQATEDAEDEPDVYNVDVVAWDDPVSALHLAIIGGHIEVINLLIDRYGADVMLPIKLKSHQRDTRAILNLVLPVILSTPNAQDTVRTLLAHGASPAQADTGERSALHHLVHHAQSRILAICEESDSEMTHKLVNHLIVGGYHLRPHIDSPLYSAIRCGRPDLVRQVLELGAGAEISFEAFMKAYSRKFEHGETNVDKLKDHFLQYVEQPIIELARHHKHVDIINDLVDNGIDVNTLSRSAQTLLQTNRASYDGGAETLLDMVQKRMNELTKYKGEPRNLPKKPEMLPEFGNPQGGDYEMWLLRTNYIQAKSIHEENMKKYQSDLEEHKAFDPAGETAKIKALKVVFDKWQTLETKLVEKGAKTWNQLHPELEHTNVNPCQRYQYSPGKSGHNKDRPFTNAITFTVPGQVVKDNLNYLNLFEAIYRGDVETTKALCLDTAHPLPITVRDSANFSPFSLSVLRGHYELAQVVLDIAAAQYEPPKKTKTTYRYLLRRPGDFDPLLNKNSDDEIEDADLRVFAELIDEKYTIDDIRLLSSTVKSQISPTDLFQWTCELWRTIASPDVHSAKAAFYPQAPWRLFSPSFADEYAAWSWFNEMIGREQHRNSFDLFRYAIATNDSEMLNFLIRIQKDLVYRKDEKHSLRALQIGSANFELALRLGHTDQISEIIRQTGTSLPLAHLLRDSDAPAEEQPRFYQGLSVHGHKREDWAREDQGQSTGPVKDRGSPLLTAILAGNIETVEYFLSDTPLRCYEEFTKSFADDKHIKQLANSKGGIERALHAWMNTRTHLAIHMAVMANPITSKSVRDFLIKRMPHLIDAKSQDGMSPLQLAFQYKHYDAARELIDAGADQMTRNQGGQNLLHTIYTCRDDLKNAQSLREIVGMLELNVVGSLTKQRCFGDGQQAQTPLMSFLNLWALRNTNDEDEDLFNAVLEFSNGEDFEIMDGSGDYPIHSLLKQEPFNSWTAKHLIQCMPDLLFKENATGLTPLEIAESNHIRAVIAKRPHISNNFYYGPVQDQNYAEIPAQHFLDPSKNDPANMSARTAYKTLRKLANQRPQKRKLVSVLDANETARRLAEQQQRNNEELKRREALGRKSYGTRHRYNNHAVNNHQQLQDEVSRWAHKASDLRMIKSDVIKFSMNRQARLFRDTGASISL